MLRFHLILLLCFFFNSCATIVHQRATSIHVRTDGDSTQFMLNKDSSRWYTAPATIQVTRSGKPLSITAVKDSLTSYASIPAKLSPAFWWGNLFFGAGVAGYAVDLTNPKRFTYPDSIRINVDANTITWHKSREWLRPRKNDLSFRISIPEGNLFYLDKGYRYGTAFGFLGISGGCEYYFTDRYSINMDVGRLTDFLIPFPAPVDHFGNYHRTFATYADIQFGTDRKRFHFDAGIQYTRTSYYERETVELFPNFVDTLKYSSFQNNMGPALSAYYRISKGFSLGINYYPSLIAWNKSKVYPEYSHLLFFELAFRIRTRNKHR